ncbi:hypothetical protein [Streptomyces sp. NPDC002851]
MTHARSTLRAFRAALFAAVCVTLGTAGHSYTSGHQVPLGGLLSALGVTGVLAWVGARRRRGPVAIGAGLLAVQGALHLAFAGAQEHAAAMGHGQDHAAMAHTQGHGSAGMLAAHLLSALLCALWLARGEAALFQLLRTLEALTFTPLRLLGAAVRLPEPPGPGRRPWSWYGPARPRTAVLAHVVSRRGPPVTARLPRYAPAAA